MELSVLDRQRAALHRLYEEQSQQNAHMDAIDDHHQQVLSQFIFHSLPDWQCNSSLSNGQGQGHGNVSSSSSSYSKKRKAEFDIEEEEKEKGVVEAEENKSEITTKTERENSTNNCSKASEVQKPDFIHVRARRGQATDSHSLAERARREKISKKMKYLQDLVPGCNKVTGKSGMLDEIINYVQSLQKQVEFLSMKLAAVNPRLDFNSIDSIFAKEISGYISSLQAVQFEAACFQYDPMQMGSSNSGQEMEIAQKAGTSSPIPEVFLDPSCVSQLQHLSCWEADWPTPFNPGFH